MNDFKELPNDANAASDQSVVMVPSGGTELFVAPQNRLSSKPRVGARGWFSYPEHRMEKYEFTVDRVEGNHCYITKDDGTKGQFIWRFSDCLNKFHWWEGKPCR